MKRWIFPVLALAAAACDRPTDAELVDLCMRATSGGGERVERWQCVAAVEEQLPLCGGLAGHHSGAVCRHAVAKIFEVKPEPPPGPERGLPHYITEYGTVVESDSPKPGWEPTRKPLTGRVAR